MAKTKISEFSATPSDNTDIDGINIAEGCAPSGINNAIRELMSQLKDQQTGASGDSFTVGGNLSVTGTSTFTGNATFQGSVQTTSGGGLSPAGSILIWGGAVNSPPTGYLVCDGSAISRDTYANLFAAIGTTWGSGNGSTTFNLPDLRDKFVVGASGTKAVASTGGSADISVTVTGTVGGTALTEAQMPKHYHQYRGANSMTAPQNDQGASYSFGNYGGGTPDDAAQQYGTFSTGGGASSGGTSTGTGNGDTHTHSFTGSGSTASGANLPPYYALAYIIRT